jgi:hypothetical protein
MGFRIRFFGGFLVRGHRFAVEVSDFVDVDGNPAAIAAAGPLWVLREEVRKVEGVREGEVPSGVSHRSVLCLWSRIAGLIGLPCANPLSL